MLKQQRDSLLRVKNLPGFTLMELIIVMAIISILAAVSIPAYRSYTERARFSGVIVATEPFKTAVTLALQSGETLSSIKNGEHGIPDSPSDDKNVAKIQVKSGVITATASKAAGGYTYVLTPNEYGTHWTVGGTCLEKGLCEA